MIEDQLTLLTLDLRSVPDPLKSGEIFEHVQRSPPTFPTMPLRCRSLPLSLRSLPFTSGLFPIGPDFQIGLDREQIVAQWNGGISLRWCPCNCGCNLDWVDGWCYCWCEHQQLRITGFLRIRAGWFYKGTMSHIVSKTPGSNNADGDRFKINLHMITSWNQVFKCDWAPKSP